RRLKRPNTRSFLPGFIQDNVDKWLSRLRINLSENLGCDLNQVAIEFAFVPVCESLGELCGAHLRDVFEDCIGFANQLDIAVLDSVMHHLDVVTGAVQPYVATAPFLGQVGGGLAE